MIKYAFGQTLKCLRVWRMRESIAGNKPGLGSGIDVPVHWRGTDVEPQTLGSEMAKVLLMGRLNGTLPVNIRQAQSVLLVITEPNALQQSALGDPPPLMLPVM